MEIAGKVFIVTGGASGLGEGSVRMFVREGGKVVIADVQADKGEALAKELGAEFKSIPKPAFLEGSITLLGGTIPVYTILVLVVAPVVAALLWYLLHRTRMGKTVRATASDREMADALGINMKALFTLVFAFGLTVLKTTFGPERFNLARCHQGRARLQLGFLARAQRQGDAVRQGHQR